MRKVVLLVLNMNDLLKIDCLCFFMVMVNVGFVWVGFFSCCMEINKGVISSLVYLFLFYVFRFILLCFNFFFL